MNTNYVYPSAQVGEFRNAMLYATGPSSYSPTAGDPVYNPGANEYINFPTECMSVSGNYRVRFVPTSAGLNIVRAGAPSPSQSGWTAHWDYAPANTALLNPANSAADGIPLSLGTLSAAATQSTLTAAGLLTVVGANTLVPGQFIVLSNGASNYGISLSGMMTQVVSATASQYTCYVGQALALAWTVNTDTLKYQVVQVTSTNLLQGLAMASPITGVLATASLLTITQANTLQVGQFVALGNGFKAASYYCNGTIVQVTSASATGWTAKWQGTIIAQTSGETATASVLVTNGGAPVAAYPYLNSLYSPITNSLAVASAATSAGLWTMTATQAFQPGMIVVFQGLGVNTTANGSIATVISSGLTQLLIKANGWTVIENTQAETAGYASVLTTGAQATTGLEVASGTNLAGETVQFAALVSSL